ncbi:MAG TPA: cytochrome ubiquinol oxidase subunit I, partial [Gemmatimonadaceae bacterium]
LGTAMALVSAWVLFLFVRRKSVTDHRWLLRLLVVVAPFGFVATEAGWTVTEVGRQPWVVQGVIRTADAVTPMPGLVVPMTIFALLYLGLASIVVTLIKSLVRETT